MVVSELDPSGWAVDADAAEPPDEPSAELGEWLEIRYQGHAAWEAVWLEGLARFDETAGWAADGALSCTDWMVGHLQMARATAFEKLRVAHELRRRPVLTDAFRAGRVTYSAVRLAARAVDAEPDTDAAFVWIAEHHTLDRLEHAVRFYLAHRSQDLPLPDQRAETRRVRTVKLGDGMVRIEAVLTEAEAAELSARLDALMSLDAEEVDPDGPDTPHHPPGAESGEESAAADSAGPPAPGRTWGERRADALMEAIRSGWGPGADRYLVHVIDQHGHLSLLGGGPLDDGDAATIGCDATRVTHVVDGDEPLRLGRASRDWTTAQRRAILVRDGGRCRFPGCQHRIVDVHHLRSWQHGGLTDIDNGILACRRHHRLLHLGWTVTGDVNRTLTFHRPTHAGRRRTLG